MTRKRLVCESNFYHITCRGNSKQIIFEEEQDYQEYLKHLKNYSINTKLDIVAYCLMNNHVHILVHDENLEMSKVIGYTNLRYAKYFNYKYERVGTLFQGRFKSKIIVDYKHLLATFRYILLNPETARICKHSSYKWSSYKLYNMENSWVNTSYVSDIIGNWDMYKSFLEDTIAEDVLNVDDDKLYRYMLYKEYNVCCSADILKMHVKRRNEIICYLNKHGAGIKQISRLSGVSTKIIQRNIKKLNDNE